MEATKHWSVQLWLDEERGTTTAHAELHTSDNRMVGTGSARCRPTDVDVPEIGDELAAARALADLAHQLSDAAASDIRDIEDRITVPPV